jgi:hypothetical protein
MSPTNHAAYAAALSELRMIRDQLVAGRAGPGDVVVLTRRAATVLTGARAALQRAYSAVDVLDAAAAADPSSGA